MYNYDQAVTGVSAGCQLERGNLNLWELTSLSQETRSGIQGSPFRLQSSARYPPEASSAPDLTCISLAKEKLPGMPRKGLVEPLQRQFHFCFLCRDITSEVDRTKHEPLSSWK